MRDMKLVDVDSVLAIERVVQAYPWTHGNFADAIDHGYICRVEEEDGEIRGYAVMRAIVDEAELLSIGVAASHQRKGIGRKMLTGMLAYAFDKLMRRVFLEVRASNFAAIALYRSAGFEQIGVRRGYYQNTNGIEDAITMACDMKANVQVSA